MHEFSLVLTLLWTKIGMFTRFLSIIDQFVHTTEEEKCKKFWNMSIFVITFATSKDKRRQKLLKTKNL
jgi:hypothetical protein